MDSIIMQLSIVIICIIMLLHYAAQQAVHRNDQFTICIVVNLICTSREFNILIEKKKDDANLRANGT